MQYKRMALLALASSMTLAGCGSPTSPVANSPLQQPATIAQPAAEVNAQPAQAANPAAPAAAQTSGNTAAPAAAPANNTNFEVKGGMGYAGNDFIVFASDRGKDKDFNEGKNDIFVFDPVLDTVLAIVGVNTDANEFNPRISDNGKWLVFQRTIKSKKHDDEKKNQDILMYSMGLKLVNTLPMLNTEEFDEYMPDVTDDGCFIVYVTEIEKKKPELRLYDVKTGDNWAVPGANRNFGDITWPTISANGKRIAYGASTDKREGRAEDYLDKKTGGGEFTGDPLDFGESNIFVYDIVSGTQLTPPFLNTAFDEYNPDLCLDGSRLLFVSNRFGTEDIFEVNLDTGWTDNLSFLNTDELDEQHPRYLGHSVERLVFQIKGIDQTWPVALRAYNRASATLDTLPVANQLYANSALRAPQSELLADEDLVDDHQP